jgi:hypothetical protein
MALYCSSLPVKALCNNNFITTPKKRDCAASERLAHPPPSQRKSLCQPRQNRAYGFLEK